MKFLFEKKNYTIINTCNNNEGEIFVIWFTLNLELTFNIIKWEQIINYRKKLIVSIKLGE